MGGLPGGQLLTFMEVAMPFRMRVLAFTLLLLCTFFSTATAQFDEFNLWADYSGSITYISNNGSVQSRRFRSFASNKSRVLNLFGTPDPKQTGYLPCHRGDVYLVLPLTNIKEINVHGDGNPLEVTLYSGEHFVAQVNSTITHAISYTPRFVFRPADGVFKDDTTYFVESNNILRLSFDPDS